MQMWRCDVCGFIYEGASAPEKCPKCGAPKEKFERIAEDKAKLIERSRLSNSLHMKLSTLLGKIAEVGEEGIKDNLDPGCLAIFTKAREEVKILQQMIKAEIQTHIGKGKWG